MFQLAAVAAGALLRSVCTPPVWYVSLVDEPAIRVWSVIDGRLLDRVELVFDTFSRSIADVLAFIFHLMRDTCIR